jgi:hypothetical protein
MLIWHVENEIFANMHSTNHTSACLGVSELGFKQYL